MMAHEPNFYWHVPLRSHAYSWSIDEVDVIIFYFSASFITSLVCLLFNKISFVVSIFVFTGLKIIHLNENRPPEIIINYREIVLILAFLCRLYTLALYRNTIQCLLGWLMPNKKSKWYKPCPLFTLLVICQQPFQGIISDKLHTLY